MGHSGAGRTFGDNQGALEDVGHLRGTRALGHSSWCLWALSMVSRGIYQLAMVLGMALGPFGAVGRGGFIGIVQSRELSACALPSEVYPTGKLQ